MLSLKNKIDLTFFSVAIVFLVLVVTAYNRAQSVQENREIIYQINNVKLLLGKILLGTIDIETGTRGYALTGQEQYLEVYKKSKTEVRMLMDSLQVLKMDEADVLLKLDSIEKLILAKKDISDSTVSARRNLGLQAAIDIIESGRGKELMDEIRQMIARYQDQQLDLLTKKLQETEKQVKTRNWLFSIFIVITFILIYIAYRTIRKTVKKNSANARVQKELITALTLQNNQMNDLTGIISHNLRAPAGNIAALIDLIDDKSDLQAYRNIFDMIRKVSVNLIESLGNLLDIHTIKTQKTVEKEPLEFKNILDKVTENLQGEILLSQATIMHDFAEAEGIAYPKIYMESIFHNLISNALKYRSPQRTPFISVSSSRQDGQTILTFSDNGLGIDLETYGDKIFGMNQIFHHHPEAKGVGLFMTKMQIESLGGKISVNSKVEAGTTFTIILD